MPKVSVIVPVYGVEKYIERCARSLFEQTLDDIEFIFVDDCSPDGSIVLLEGVIEQYPERKKDVKIVRSESNSGPAICRKIGFDNSLGEYIIFCDSDDWVEKQWCRQLYEHSIADELDVCICDYRMVTDDSIGKPIQSYFDDEDFLISLLRCRVTGSMWNKLVNRELLLSPDFIWPTQSFSEDWAYSIQVSLLARKIGHVHQVLNNYYRHDESIVMTRDKEMMLQKQEMNIANNIIVESLLKKYGKIDECYEAFTVSRLNVKNFIRPLTSDKTILRQWRKTYPCLLLDMIKSEYITKRQIIAYLITYLGIHNQLKRKQQNH